VAESTGVSLALRARGSLACFTRPELKVERMSYPLITPSAARGLLEAVLWKPAIRWVIEYIRVLSPIEFAAFRRNEVNSRAREVSAAVVSGGATLSDYFADEDRAQRNTVALRDVDYVIEARFEMTERAGAADNVNKFIDMFRRRVEKGQHFHQPYFGCREFVAEVLSADGAPDPIPDTRDLGLMLWDIEYAAGRNRPIFFAARLDAGVMTVPPSADAALATLPGASRREGHQ
jgi:CRISPR-associated protein Cas5d